jgi:hypothetical protein
MKEHKGHMGMKEHAKGGKSEKHHGAKAMMSRGKEHLMHHMKEVEIKIEHKREK